MVLGWQHSHPHPPTFGLTLPSLGPVICVGATNVLINGLPAARNGAVRFAGGVEVTIRCSKSSRVPQTS
jgi:uncharacterized Zn-binding protein involved in type VI secretion